MWRVKQLCVCVCACRGEHVCVCVCATYLISECSSVELFIVHHVSVL
jgi:hypothetical protein